MEIQKGTTVRIKYNCKFQDGRPYLSADKETLTFKVGANVVPPTLESAMMGMRPGEHRIIRIPASEVALFPFPKGGRARSEGPPGMAYDFGPGEGGDVSGGSLRPPPTGRDLNIEVEVLAVE